MRLLTPSQAYELDHLSIKEFNISGKTLMGNAGQCIAEKALELIAHFEQPKIFVICGKGNNGGDGFSAASIIHKYQYRINIHSIISKEKIKGDSLFFHRACEKLNIPITYGLNIPEIQESNLIIDGLLGIGLKGELSKELQSWIKWINQLSLKVLAIDIPSGLNGFSGNSNPNSVKADVTLTFGAPKIGMIFRNGPHYSGDVRITDIGYPNLDDIKLTGMEWRQFSESKAKLFLKKPRIDLNKYLSGKVLIIAGSKNMTGAAILSTYGALRCGTGLTITVAPSSLNAIYERTIIEGMTYCLEDNGLGHLDETHFDEIMDKVEWADSVLIGPGMGRFKSTKKLIIKLVKNICKPVILDADGLFPFSGALNKLNNRKHPLVITPHLGELSNLTGYDSDRIIADFPNIMDDKMKMFNHTILVKQIPICTFNSKIGIVNTTGNPGLATAGTGDVLAGMISGLIAQGLDTFDAAALGSFIHGKASDYLAREKGYRGQVASDLLNTVPLVISDYERS